MRISFYHKVCRVLQVQREYASHLFYDVTELSGIQNGSSDSDIEDVAEAFIADLINDLPGLCDDTEAVFVLFSDLCFVEIEHCAFPPL